MKSKKKRVTRGEKNVDDDRCLSMTYRQGRDEPEEEKEGGKETEMEHLQRQKEKS